MDNETTLEAILVNQNQKADETINALETIISQNENNKVDDILEAQLVTLDNIDKKIENTKLELEIDGAEVISIKGDTGEKGDKGDKGDTGANGKDGKDGVDGKDGADGKDGINGVDGISPNVDEITRDVLETIVPKIPTAEELMSLVTMPKDGKDGKNGKNGKNGKDIDPKKIKDFEDNLSKIHSIASKTVSLVELDDVNLSGLTQTNGKYNLGSGGGGGAVDSVNGQTGVVVLTKSDISLGNVDNTSDVNKPVSTATQTALDGKVDENIAITGATKTKVTYDAKGLVTAGADATTADIADSTNARYVTDAQLIVIGNTSGTNTGDNATNSQYSGLASSKQDTITGLTASGSELNILDGATLTTTELNYVDGVTSAIQDQIDTKPVDEIVAMQALGSTYKCQTVGITPGNIVATLTLASQQVRFTPVYIKNSITITGVAWYQKVKGSYTANNNNRIGLYSYSGGTLTLVASCADDGTLWQTAASESFGSKNFSSTYAASPGIYFVAFLYSRSAEVTAPQIGCDTGSTNLAVSSYNFTNSAKLFSVIGNQTNLPSPTTTMSATTGVGNRVWVALY